MRRTWLCLALSALLLLTGCMGNIPEQKESTGETLPEVRVVPAAPVGDNQATRYESASLHLPNEEGTRLTAVVRTVEMRSGQTWHEACMETLLEEINASAFYTDTRPLQLNSVSNPVETSGNLVTVDLASSARVLTWDKLYALKMAITNTLTEIPGTDYVNILINGQDTGLDIQERIPTGVITKFPSGDISSQLEQIRTQRESQTGEMKKTAALYFVSSDGSALLGEIRNITLHDQDQGEYARLLLEELAIGAVTLEDAKTVVPGWEYFVEDPVFYTDASSARYIRLNFLAEIDSHLNFRGLTRGMLLSSICYTLINFIPGLTGVITYIGGELVTELTWMDGTVWTSQNGVLQRRDVAPLAADTCTVYFPLSSGTGLRAVKRPIAQRYRTNPRAMLRELMNPQVSALLSPALPEGVTDADILGLQTVGDAILVNVSEAFREACQGMDATQERNMVYAIVNTLTEIDGITRVRFYVNGEQRSFAGYLFMHGEFLRNTGLIR